MLKIGYLWIVVQLSIKSKNPYQPHRPYLFEYTIRKESRSAVYDSSRFLVVFSKGNLKADFHNTFGLFY